MIGLALVFTGCIFYFILSLLNYFGGSYGGVILAFYIISVIAGLVLLITGLVLQILALWVGGIIFLIPILLIVLYIVVYVMLYK